MLVTKKRSGKSILYTLNKNKFEAINDLTNDILNLINYE